MPKSPWLEPNGSRAGVRFQSAALHWKRRLRRCPPAWSAFARDALDPAPQCFVERIVAALLRASHQHLEHRGEEPGDVLNMGEPHLLLGNGVNGELAVAGAETVASDVARPGDPPVRRHLLRSRLTVKVGPSRNPKGQGDRA